MPYTQQKTYGATMALHTATLPDASLTLGWQHQIIKYGSDPFGFPLKTGYDFFNVGFHLNW